MKYEIQNYTVKCAACETVQVLKFKVREDAPAFYVYSNHFDGEYGKHAKRRKCKTCGKQELFMYTSEEESAENAKKIPGVLGGSRNYMSMERYWAHNKGELRRKEDALAKKMADRHEKRVTSNIDKQRERQGSDKRHQGYGEGQREQKLNSDS